MLNYSWYYNEKDACQEGNLILDGYEGSAIPVYVYNGAVSYPKWSNGDNRKPYEEFKNRSCALVIDSFDPNILVIDVDGKNGGLDTIDCLGLTDDNARTLYQVSKSGNGFHLFYKVPQGFPKVRLINYVKGVDILSRGLVLSLIHQLNNGHKIADLPKHLQDAILRYMEQRAAERANRYDYNSDPSSNSGMCNRICYEKTAKGGRNSRIFSMGIARARSGDSTWRDHMRHAGETNGMIAEIEASIRVIEGYIS